MSTLDLSKSTVIISGEGTINSTNQTGKLGLDSTRLVFLSTSSVNSNLYPLSGKNSLWSIDYTVPTGTELIIQADTLKVKGSVNITQGTINSNGFLKLLSETDTTSAYVKNLSLGGQITGNVIVQRHMNGEGKLWRYISSPVVGATVEQLQNYIPITGLFAGASAGYTNNPSMFYYDESVVGDEWVNFPDVSNQEELITGKGYAIWIREAINATIAEVTGPLNQGDINFSQLAEGAVNDGWNLIGNPYASPVKWEDPLNPSAWILSGVTNSIAVPDNGIGGGGYHYWNGSVGSLTDGIIAPWQAFWVQTTSANPSITITEDAKYDSLGATFYRTSKENPHYIEMKLSNGIREDLAYVQFVTEATDEYDKKEDAFKRHNAYFNLSSLSADSVALAINVVQTHYCTKTIQLNIGDTEPGQYNISFDLTNSIRFNESYVLYDRYLDETTELDLENNYQFDITSDSATFNFRFSLIVEKGEIDTSVLVSEKEHCVDQSLSVVLDNSQYGVAYEFVYSDETSSVPVIGTGYKISIPLDTGKVAVGKSTLKLLEGYPMCALEQIAFVEVDRIEVENAAPEETTLTVCSGDDVILKFDKLPVGSKFRYYKDSTLIEFVDFTDSLYTINSLMESSSFYFSALNRLSCEGEITRVDVNVSSLTEPILAVQGDSLVSSYSGPNQWYLNDFLIEEVQGSSFIPTESGDYKVSVSEGSCVLYSVDLSFAILGLNNINDDPGISIYPNPLGRGMPLHLKGRNLSKVTEIIVLSGIGEIVSNCNYQVKDNTSIDLTLSQNLSSGLYYLYVKYEDKTSVKKFILKE